MKKYNKTWNSINDEVSDIVLNGSSKNQNIDDLLEELQQQFIEMGQLKSDFDIEKFTVRKEGNFLAHNFHFLMRQYSLTLTELRRMLLEREEQRRYIEKYKKLLNDGVETTKVMGEFGEEDKWVDIELARQWNSMKALDVTMTNKIAMIRKFEEVRQKLIEMNGGNAPTNAEYQKETPQYWKWFFEKLSLWQVKAHATGITRGTWENIDLLERSSVINPEFQIKMLNDDGMLDLKQIELESELEKQLSESRIKKMLDSFNEDNNDSNKMLEES